MESNRDKVLREVVRDQGVFMGLFLAYTRDPWVAEDLFQDLVVLSCEKYEQADLSRPLRPWLLQIARNLARDHLRKASKQPANIEALVELAEDPVWETTATSTDERRKALYECLDLLQGPSRQMVEMKYVQKLSISSIAASLKRKADAVYKALARVRCKLEECVEAKLL